MTEWTNFKPRGTVGELSVARDLILKGYPVFTEMGDNSRVDLIALIDDLPVKIQVKTSLGDKGLATLPTIKRTFGYKYTYLVSDVDLFALYVMGSDQVLYVSAREALEQKSQISFRLSTVGRSNQFKQRLADDYLDLHKALRYISMDNDKDPMV